MSARSLRGERRDASCRANGAPMEWLYTERWGDAAQVSALATSLVDRACELWQTPFPFPKAEPKP